MLSSWHEMRMNPTIYTRDFDQTLFHAVIRLWENDVALGLTDLMTSFPHPGPHVPSSWQAGTTYFRPRNQSSFQGPGANQLRCSIRSLGDHWNSRGASNRLDFVADGGSWGSVRIEFSSRHLDLSESNETITEETAATNNCLDRQAPSHGFWRHFRHPYAEE